jgi:hypothetical protein
MIGRWRILPNRSPGRCDDLPEAFGRYITPLSDARPVDPRHDPFAFSERRLVRFAGCSCTGPLLRYIATAQSMTIGHAVTGWPSKFIGITDLLGC